MGDMADFALDCGFDDLENLEKYRSGLCDIHEAFELGIIDEFGVEYPGSRSLPIPSKPFVPVRSLKAKGPGQCPYCGKVRQENLFFGKLIIIKKSLIKRLKELPRILIGLKLLGRV